MTSKEALEQIKTAPSFMGGNGTQSSSLFLEDIAVIEKALDKLDKYEKAFEILKEKFEICKKTYAGGCLYTFSGYYNNEYLKKEEYELLEEVWNYEKN